MILRKNSDTESSDLRPNWFRLKTLDSDLDPQKYFLLILAKQNFMFSFLLFEELVQSIFNLYWINTLQLLNIASHSQTSNMTSSTWRNKLWQVYYSRQLKAQLNLSSLEFIFAKINEIHTQTIRHLIFLSH